MTDLADPAPFDRDRDLEAIVELVGRARADGSGYLHPGGLQWWLRRIGRERFAVHVWRSGRDLAGFAMEDDGYVIVEAAERTATARGALIGWCEDRLRTAGRASIEVSARDGDTELVTALRSRGYIPAGTLSEELVYDLSARPPAPVLPDGFRAASLETVADDDYVDMHRDAWSTVAPSPYDREQHERVTAMPEFRRDMVAIVVAPDGMPAAYCIGWFDRHSGRVEIEPLGTRPAFRRRGLGTAVVREIIRRSHDRGASAVMVWSSHANHAAKRMYEAAGLRPRGVVREYRKPL